MDQRIRFLVTEDVLDTAAVELAKRLIVLTYLEDVREAMDHPAGKYREMRLAGLKNRLRGELRNLSR